MNSHRIAAQQQQDSLSPASDVDHNGNSTTSSTGAKRRPSRAGTRSVATLSATQLERKRANDREAQRAIRQRTKENTERLEQRIRELEAPGQPTHEQLNAALRRNKDLEDEVAYLRVELHKVQVSMGVQNDGGAVWENGVSTSRTPLPSNGGQIVNQPQAQPPALNELPRSDPYGTFRPPQWQGSTQFGAGPRPKREPTPSNVGDNSPESNAAWAADRNRMSEQRHSGPQQAEYAHMMVPPAQAMPVRPNNHVLPYQTPPQEPQGGYHLAPHSGQQVAPNNYAPVQSYLPQHAQQQQHAHQHPSQQPSRPLSTGPRQEQQQQQVFYNGFSQG